MPIRYITFSAVLLSIFFIVNFMQLSQSIIIPFIFAVLFFNLLSTIANFFQEIPWIGKYLPRWFAIAFALLILMIVFTIIGKILTENMQQMLMSSETMQFKLNALLQRLAEDGLSKTYTMNMLKFFFQHIHFQYFVSTLYSTVSKLMSSVFLMILFVIFFFFEQHYFVEKMSRIFTQKNQNEKVMFLLKSIPNQIQFYLGLKSLFSLMTALLISLILQWMHVEFAAFWGVCVFFLNFIPNIGAIAITLMITLFGYFQWYDISQTFILLISQLLIHVVVGNVLETRYLGRALHLSPFCLVMSLCFWGMIWGGIGLFLAVPMTVSLMIVLGSFHSTRIYAMMLSEKGELPKECDEIYARTSN